MVLPGGVRNYILGGKKYYLCFEGWGGKEGEGHSSKGNSILKSLRSMKEHGLFGGTASRLVMYQSVCGGEWPPVVVLSNE